MNRALGLLALSLLNLCVAAAFGAPLQVVTTTTDLAWLASQIGGDEVQVESLLSGDEDPHYVDAVPRYIHRVAGADMVCIVGMDLEIGWIPKVLSKAANARVQPGGSGYCQASDTVTALDVVAGSVDRSMGDVHPDGNPHYHLSPEHMLQAGETILGTLIALSPDASDAFLQNFETLSRNLLQLQADVQQKLSPLQGVKLFEYHKDFSYYAKAYGLSITGAVEAVPGVPPSAGRLARTAINAKNDGVRLLVAARHNPAKVLRRFSSLSKVPYVQVFTSIQRDGEIRDYHSLQHHIADSLLQAASQDN